MINFIVYSLATGEIYHTGCCPVELVGLQLLEEGQGILSSGSIGTPNTHYVNEGMLEAKLNHPLSINKTTFTADDADEIIITGLHSPTTVIVEPGEYEDEVTDGEYRLSTDQARRYTITLKSIPYLDEVITVEAVA